MVLSLFFLESDSIVLYQYNLNLEIDTGTGMDLKINAAIHVTSVSPKGKSDNSDFSQKCSNLFMCQQCFFWGFT